MRKYPIKVTGREFTVLAQNKAEADNIYYRLRKLARVTACHCTLYGVRPANETEAERDALYAEAKAGSGFAESVFSPAPLPEEIATWFAALPAAIDKQFILAHDDEMDALFLKYLPIDDCRKTQAEIAETDANIAQAEAAREAKAETFRREHGSEYIAVCLVHRERTHIRDMMGEKRWPGPGRCSSTERETSSPTKTIPVRSYTTPGKSPKMARSHSTPRKTASRCAFPKNPRPR